MIVCVDTQIWVFAYGRPSAGSLTAPHSEARNFLSDILRSPEITIAISLFQAAEILELLRRIGTSTVERTQLWQDFSCAKFCLKALTTDHVEEALILSMKSSVHIWDYLVVLPLKDIVRRIYSADRHLLETDDFSNIAEVVNPLSWNMVEGQEPRRISS
jgi:predicted nucleic acid-binding protein